MEFIITYLLIINSLGTLIMYVDKRRAEKKKHRIKESALWKAAIFGGAIGTTTGMYVFRHKTKHISFKFGFPLLAILQIGLLFYFTAIYLPSLT